MLNLEKSVIQRIVVLHLCMQKSNKQKQEKYSAFCCFLVNSDNILRNDFDFYYDTLKKMKKWS